MFVELKFERPTAPCLTAFLAAEPGAKLVARFDRNGFWTVEVWNARGYAMTSACRDSLEAALRRLDAEFSTNGVSA